MTALKVGDICAGQNFVISPEFNGQLCTIVSPLRMRLWRGDETGDEGCEQLFGVEWANGETSVQPAHNLRKIDPPAADDAAARQAMLDCIDLARRPVEVPA